MTLTVVILLVVLCFVLGFAVHLFWWLAGAIVLIWLASKLLTSSK